MESFHNPSKDVDKTQKIHIETGIFCTIQCG